jgi:hypothetical protein
MSSELATDDNIIRFSITDCSNCVFYSNKYCALSQRLNTQYGTYYPTFVANEWKQMVTPTRCPLKNGNMLFSLSTAPDCTEGVNPEELDTIDYTSEAKDILQECFGFFSNIRDVKLDAFVDLVIKAAKQ